MPMYTCRCSNCELDTSYYSTIANRSETPKCQCGADTEKIMDKPMVSAMAFTGHKGFHMPDGAGSSRQGTWIESGTAYKQYLREKNVIPESEGRREAEIKAASIKADDKIKLKKAVEKAVIQHTNK